MSIRPRKISARARESVVPDVADVFENCVGCKWTIRVLNQIRRGVRRPGEIVRAMTGLSTKVLNERLAKLVRFGVLDKTSYPEIPPRVEYELTAFGKRIVAILDEVEKLQREMNGSREPGPQYRPDQIFCATTGLVTRLH
jgi:DNA-binding HxlR family transcriptional regulator